jgi:hypothetical protein
MPVLMLVLMLALQIDAFLLKPVASSDSNKDLEQIVFVCLLVLGVPPLGYMPPQADANGQVVQQ